MFTILTILFTSYITFPFTNDQTIVQTNINNLGYDVNFSMNYSPYGLTPIQNDYNYSKFVSSVLTNYSQILYYSEDSIYFTNVSGYYGILPANQQLLVLNLSTDVQMIEKYISTRQLGISNQLDYDLNELNMTNGIPNIILNIACMNYYKYKIGEIINFHSPINNNTTEFKIIDEYSYWPGFSVTGAGSAVKLIGSSILLQPFAGIISQNSFDKYQMNVTGSSFIKYEKSGHFNFVKGTSFEDQSKLYYNILNSNKNILASGTIEFQSLADSILTARESLTYLIQWDTVGLLTSLLAAYCILISISFLINIYELLKRDFAILRTIGLSLGQERIIFVLIVIFFIFGSMFFGFVLGVAAYYLEEWVYYYTNISQIILVVPYTIILSMFTLVVVLSFIISFFYIISNKKIDLLLLNRR